MRLGVHKTLRAIFTLTLFLSSGLLFLVQPMVAKMILPQFGGSTAVWTTSMLFFQILLLAGYAYAHFATRWLGTRVQSILHLCLLIVAAILLPIALPKMGGDIVQGSPLQVLGTLALMVGIPFFVLSAGAPLIQRWFAATKDPAAKDPYFLYSASNLGSMIALLAYPFLLEPRLRLGEQSNVWTYGFYALVGAMLVCAALLPKNTPETVEKVEDPAPTNRQRLHWVLLAAIPSSLLLGVTNYLTANLAPMPLLWVLPLGLYLLTFIIAFARRPLAKSAVWARLLPLIVTPLALIMILEATEPIAVLAGIHILAFTVAALMCHTLLVELRPCAGRLTEFYLWMSVGGALGGLFNAVIAPVIFSTLAEYPIAIIAACLVRPPNANLKPALKFDIAFAAGMLALTMGLVIFARAIQMPPSQARTGLIIGLPAILCFLMVDRPIRYALMLGSLFFASNLLHTNSAGEVVHAARSFFGVHRVITLDRGRFFELVHGNTIHGLQDRQNPGEPLTYYTRTGPIGEIFKAYPDMQDVALVGLGVGSCAAYGTPGQKMTYFEIDPVVVNLAQDPQYFTFLKDTKADLNVVLGDARLTLDKKSDGEFDLIALDAFSSDSIPVHLLTKEAVAMYVSKLKPTGFLAFHISNRYLDLAPILANVAKSLGMVAALREDAPTTDEEKAGKRPSRWVVMYRRAADVEALNTPSRWDPIDPSEKMPLWTDDYSNILSAFKQE